MADCVFVDTETTGLDDVDNDIIDIWVERRDHDTLELKKSGGGHVSIPKEQLVRLHRPSAPNKPSAAEVNHYTDAAWADAQPWPVRCAEFAGVFVPGETILWIGSNPWFDIDMVRAMNWKYGTRSPRVRLIVRNTVEMGERHKEQLGLKFFNLAALAKKFGLPAQDHTARGDVQTCVEVYRELRKLGG